MDIDHNKGQGCVENVFTKIHSAPITSVDWSKRTSRLASIDQKGTILVWN